MEGDDKPPVFNYILGFLLVGVAWGFTTPFIRRAARTHKPPAHPVLDEPRVRQSLARRSLYRWWFAVVDLLRNPAYVVPLGLNVTGSVWFFLLIGKAGEFCPLVGGEWLCEGDLEGRAVFANVSRAEPHGSDCELACVLVYRARRVVG